jgi:hypothetical protein
LAVDQYVQSPDTGAASGRFVPPDVPTMAPTPSKPASTSRAWPLIIVALAAGGLPFLWMYRANMPLPKAWQIQGPSAAGSAVVPVPAPGAPPAVTANVVPPAPPVLAPANAGPTPTPAAHAKAAIRHPAARVANKGPAKPAAAVRPCTEALAALDLCDGKPARK